MYLLYLMLGFGLLQYQNCAPAPENADGPIETEVVVDNPDGTADVIDRVQVGDISFPQSKLQAYSDEQVVVIGACGQSGSLISWTLRDGQGVSVEKGLSECDLGAFEVALSDKYLAYCGQSLSLSAALGAKASSDMQVDVNCD